MLTVAIISALLAVLALIFTVFFGTLNIIVELLMRNKH